MFVLTQLVAHVRRLVILRHVLVAATLASRQEEFTGFLTRSLGVVFVAADATIG